MNQALYDFLHWPRKPIRCHNCRRIRHPHTNDLVYCAGPTEILVDGNRKVMACIQGSAWSAVITLPKKGLP